MPHANIWIREEDWKQWQSIEAKSTFVHNAIRALKQSKGLDALHLLVDDRTSKATYSNSNSDPIVVPVDD